MQLGVCAQVDFLYQLKCMESNIKTSNSYVPKNINFKSALADPKSMLMWVPCPEVCRLTFLRQQAWSLLQEGCWFLVAAKVSSMWWLSTHGFPHSSGGWSCIVRVLAGYTPSRGTKRDAYTFWLLAAVSIPRLVAASLLYLPSSTHSHLCYVSLLQYVSNLEG